MPKTSDPESHWTQKLQKSEVILSLVEGGRSHSTHDIKITFGALVPNELPKYIDFLRKISLFRNSSEVDRCVTEDGNPQNGTLSFHEKLADPQAVIASLAEDLREMFGVRVAVVVKEPIVVKEPGSSRLGRSFFQCQGHWFNKDKIRHIELNAKNELIENGVRIYWDDGSKDLWGDKFAAELRKILVEEE